MPGPWSRTPMTTSSDAARTATRTGEPPCLRALPIRLARITSRRRGSRRAWMPRSASRSTASSHARVDARGDLVGHVDVVQDQPGRTRVEAGDLHEVLDQVVEPARLADHQPHGRLDHRVHRAGLRLQLLLEDLRDGGDRGERRTEFMAHVRHEAPRGVVAGGHVVDPFLQRLGRVVERPREIGEFVGARHAEPGVQLALAEPARGDPEPVHRLQYGRRGGLREQRGADQGQPGGDTQRPGQGVEVLGLRLEDLSM